MQIDTLGEFGLINQITKNMVFAPDELVVGIGDDCAVLPFSEEEYLLLSCDMMMEGSHFLVDEISPYQLGYKAVAINLSDIAAMGGSPNSILISIGLPKNIDVDYCEELYRGVRDICQQFHVNLVGGDTVRTSGEVAINVTVVGRVKKENLHLRNMAKEGEYVFVTGPLGGSHAGLQLILQGDQGAEKELKDALLKSHYLPVPCCKEAQVLSSELGVSALNDISDGVASEAWEIAEASNVGIVIDPEKLPVATETQWLAERLQGNLQQWALFGGEDYQLVGTACAEKWEELSQAYERAVGHSLYRIGEVVQGNGVYLTQDGKKVPLAKAGFNHFG